MIVHTFTLAMHVLYRSVQAYGPLARTLEYILPGVKNYFGSRTMSIKAKTLNSKHLKKGDPLPPYNGVLRLYNMRYCPFAQRTVLVLNAKEIDYEVVNVNLVEKPEWLASKSPFTKVPALEIAEDVCICESLVTSEYLDDAYPQRRLQATDPLVRARDKIIIEYCMGLHALLFRSIKTPELVDDALKTRFYSALDHIQQQLTERRSAYLGGDRPGYVDYMVWPWFERLELLKGDYGSYWPLPGKYARLVDYIEKMKQDPAVSQYLIPQDIYVKFFEGYRSGDLRYDLLDEQ